MAMPGKIYTTEDGDYKKNNPTWHVEDSAWKAKQILKMLKRNSLQPKSVAEVGCGAGEILNQLHQRMPTDTVFRGYDVASDAITLAKTREKERLTFRQAGSFDDNFDLMLMIDVFEHIDDYMGFLRSFRGKAKYTIFHIPLDLSVQMILRNKLIAVRKSVGHLHYFMKETALSTVTDTGYEVVDSFYTAGLLDLPRSIQAKFAFLPRKILFKINQNLAARLVGGFSLMVLAKPVEDAAT